MYAKKKFLFLIIVLLGFFVLFLRKPKPIQIKILDKVSVYDQSKKQEPKTYIIYTVDNKNKEIKIDSEKDYYELHKSEKNKRYFFNLFEKPDPIETREGQSDKQPPLNLCFIDDFRDNDNEKIKLIRDFFIVAAGTHKEYIEQTKYKKLRDKLWFSSNLENFSILPYSQPILQPDYLENIKNISKTESSSFKIDFEFNNYSTLTTKLFVSNVSTPIQWPHYLEWNWFGYFWNVLIISIGSFLYFFSNFLFFKPSYVLGNLGLGVILTTIFIRTLTWPIYTKTSTFSMSMSLVQPEVEKVRQKYVLKKDSASAQKMQLEILKVYRKHNFSFWGFLISFLQLPLFIAINQTLNSFMIPGGIFNTSKLVEKSFLNFIKLNSLETNDYKVTTILLSFLVGATMFVLNKVSLKKPEYLKPSHHLTIEQKVKAKQSEKTMKIMSWFMILMMVWFSRSNRILSLYWIVGNSYTIFQTLITRKKMAQRYLLLKQGL